VRRAGKPQPSFDLEFRPSTYWEYKDALSIVLRPIKGRLRREMVADVLTATGEKRRRYRELLGDLDQLLFTPDGGPGWRAEMGRVDPRWMGGEYLPDLLSGEVEIARISLESITYDVYSLRAHRDQGVIHYRMEDEYESDWELKRRESREPLTMGELITLIDASRMNGVDSNDLTDWLRDRTAEHGDVEEAAAFVTVSSEFYPELQSYYDAKARAWADRWRVAHPAEDDPEDSDD
jgi:hypothetical protein